VISVIFVLNPARHPRPPHIARVDYDNEHRCAEHEHDPVSLSVIFRVIPWLPPRA
jgi:hypothetical protein